MMQESYKFQVDCRGGDGIQFEISPDQTLLHMMTLICEEWLDDYRDGDGAVYGHLWKFVRHDHTEYGREDTTTTTAATASTTTTTAPTSNTHQWTQEQKMALDNYLMTRGEFPDSLPINVPLKRFRWWNIGTSVPVEYDYGSTTSFHVRLVAKQTIADDIVLPRIALDEADKVAETFVPFVPKAGSPNVNEIFPHANKMMFQMGSKWLCPYPCSPTSGGFVEGKGGDSDLIFIPEPFESLQHALIGMDKVAAKWPQNKGYSRSVFAMELSERGERYYTERGKLIQEYLDFAANNDTDRIGISDMGHLSDYIQYQLFCPEVSVFYRLTKEDVKNFEPAAAKVDEIFPLCAKVYRNGVWASYHRGKVKICKGNDSGERGVPKTVLAQVAHQVTSLHDFFCVCEALLQRVESNKVFSNLKKTVALDPHLIN
ncbi:unnamed protein product [Cylindrotheca closterium]|uniref:Uncharacterized protein n=1 Tax=Cylindrotheca closterium TaxID=2856 RepID=A0AAD2FPT7_9STRA|nr:unnamed protein product [Cylindrotheca closterium]